MKTKKKLIIGIALCLFSVVFVVSLYQIGSKLYEYEKNKKKYQSLSNEYITVVPIEDTEQTKETVPISVDFDHLLDKNSDIIGWIYCANTPINYPVVQSDDNEFYLRRSLTGEYDIGGTIFMDYQSDSAITDNNTVIYGHNMLNDTMFGTLVRYKKQPYYDEHPVLWYLTPQKKYKIELFSGFLSSSADGVYCNLYDPEKFR